MSKTKAEDLWLEFMWAYPDGTRGHCGLCGNRGIVDTVGRAKTATGLACGVQRYCICPNGRQLLKGWAGGKQAEVSERTPETPHSMLADVEMRLSRG